MTQRGHDITNSGRFLKHLLLGKDYPSERGFSLPAMTIAIYPRVTTSKNLTLVISPSDLFSDDRGHSSEHSCHTKRTKRTKRTERNHHDRQLNVQLLTHAENCGVTSAVP